LTNKNLEGELDLSDFKNLEELDCGDNELKTLKLNEINDLTKLVHLDCRDNYLPDLKLPSSTGLTYLTIRNNNLSKRNLSMFSHLTNLEILYIGSDEHDQDKVDKGIYNKFEGSLKYLKNLENLTELSISSTDID
ncbi:22063_t:CDS:2, partial [Racocetra persica]